MHIITLFRTKFQLKLRAKYMQFRTKRAFTYTTMECSKGMQ